MRLMGVLLGSAIFSSPALADPVDFQGGALVRQEATISLGLTIPLGVTRDREPPRVELRMVRDQRASDGSRLSTYSTYQAETRIGLDLAPDHRMRLNGRLLEKDRRQGISTVGWVAIGVGVIGVAAVDTYSGVFLPDEDE